MVAGLEAVHCRANDALEVVHRRRFDALRSEPIDREVLAMAGLRIKRQDLLVQPLTQYPQVVRAGRPKSQQLTDRLPMAAALATIEFVIGQRIDRGSQLHPQPSRRVGVKFLRALGKSAMNLHEFELGGKPQPTFVGHARQQGDLFG